MGIKHQSPAAKKLKRLTQESNQHEAVDYQPTGWWSYRAVSRTNSKDFGMFGKTTRRARR
jgi:hypothetical protein